MAFEVGKAVSVELLNGPPLRGFVHAKDKPSGLVILELIPGSDLALVYMKNVKTMALITGVEHGRKWPANPVVDMGKLKVDQEGIFKKRREEFGHIGIGVSMQAQAIFDVIVKTTPCVWEKDVIVVLDAVRLSPPYDEKSIKSISGLSGTEKDKGLVDWVRRVLTREAQSIRSAADTNGVAQ